MRIVIRGFYVFAALVACSFALSSTVLIAGIVSDKPDHSDGMTAFGDLVGLALLLASFVAHGFFAILFLACAELTRRWTHKRLPS